jgi:hypothetical protein
MTPRQLSLEHLESRKQEEIIDNLVHTATMQLMLTIHETRTSYRKVDLLEIVTAAVQQTTALPP